MRRSKPRFQTRSIVAAILICASFLSAYVLSSMANRTELLWSAKTSLVPGSRISLNDLVPIRASIPGGSGAYISSHFNVRNFFVLRSIGPGEFLPVAALSAQSKIQTYAVPISFHASDLPINLQVGEEVNLYHAGDSRLVKEIGPPILVLAHAFIQGIDRKGQNLGGDLTLTLTVSNKSILSVLDATSTGRLVVVRIHG